jgi:hypothetical protein
MWTDRRLMHDDVGLAWVEQGEGPVVIFLSGGPGVVSCPTCAEPGDPA